MKFNDAILCHFILSYISFHYVVSYYDMSCHVMLCDSNRVDLCRQAMVNRTIRLGAGLKEELTIEGSNKNIIINNTSFVEYGGVKEIRWSDEKWKG